MPLLATIPKHPLPPGEDDPRFIVTFPKAMEIDGRWIPYKYAENPYYQFFHELPFLVYALVSISGFSFENIEIYYILLKLILYIIYLLLIYLIVKTLTEDATASLIAMLLLTITPPIASIRQVIPQIYAIILALATSLLIIQGLKAKRVVNLLAILPLVFAGLVAHASYVLVVGAFLIPFLKHSIKKTLILLLLLIILSLIYWSETHVLVPILIKPFVDGIIKSVYLLIGQTPAYFNVPQPWYTPKMSNFFIAWALVPSLAGAYVLTTALPAILKKKLSFSDTVSVLGLIGLVGIILSYLLRNASYIGIRYFYWIYLLIIPMAAYEIRKYSRSLLGLIFSVIIVSIATFYGIQDPTAYGNTYGNYLPVADKTSWNIAKSLAPIINDSMDLWIDWRIVLPIGTMFPPQPAGVNGPASISENSPCLAIVGMDNLGIAIIHYQPNELIRFKQCVGITPETPKALENELDMLDIVYKSGIYYGIMKTPK
jgi:hypothetical protein